MCGLADPGDYAYRETITPEQKRINVACKRAEHAQELLNKFRIFKASGGITITAFVDETGTNREEASVFFAQSDTLGKIIRDEITKYLQTKIIIGIDGLTDDMNSILGNDKPSNPISSDYPHI